MSVAVAGSVGTYAPLGTKRTRADGNLRLTDRESRSQTKAESSSDVKKKLISYFLSWSENIVEQESVFNRGKRIFFMSLPKVKLFCVLGF